jgi:hypothetical protein
MSDAVDTYPADPRPWIVERRDNVEIAGRFRRSDPSPCTVETVMDDTVCDVSNVPVRIYQILLVPA